MNNKNVIMFTVDVEALPPRDVGEHVEHLIYNRFGGKEYGIIKFMDIADKYGFKMTFFLDLAEYELYGDEIVAVGKLILKREHDLQVHLHHGLLKKRFDDYPAHYMKFDIEDTEIARKYVGYIQTVWSKITDKKPVAYRGGGYRFGAELLRELKSAGFKCDCSYNCLRPFRLPNYGAFQWENGLIELPISIVSGNDDINYNFGRFYPESPSDFKASLSFWLKSLKNFFTAKPDTPATIMMHSWCMLNLGEKHPKWEPCEEFMLEWTDLLFKTLSENYTIKTVEEVLDTFVNVNLPVVDFSIIPNTKEFSETVVANKGDRKVVVWGNGYFADSYFGHLAFDVDFVITSANNSGEDTFRGLPVKLVTEIDLNPRNFYVVVLNNPVHIEVRKQLRDLGFTANSDYFDFLAAIWNMREKAVDGCNVCGANRFSIVPYNSVMDRICNVCGSVERSRVFHQLLNENTIDVKGKNILHVSPSESEKKSLLFFGADKTVSIDIRPAARTNIIANIQSMPQIESEQFDMVVAIKMLEHCKDDNAALSEITRVLKPGGIFVCYVCPSGSERTVDEDDVSSWYSVDELNAYGVGSFRRYGSVDFPNQLRKYFSDIRVMTRTDEPSGIVCDFYSCTK